MEIHSPAGALPHIPDDLTVPQFIFDCEHSTRPRRNASTPWLIEDDTGKKISGDELRRRTLGLANGLRLKYGILLLFSRNHIDYPVAIWAAHRLGAVISGANPDFSSNELLYQLRETEASIIIVHPDALATALSAALEAGVSSERVVLFNAKESVPSNTTHETVNDLIELGLRSELAFVERRLRPGEAKTKLAFLSFSSGTTGKPKAVAIPHYAPIANVIQIAAHNKVNEAYCDWKDRRYRPGDVAIGVLPLYHIYGLVINLHFILFTGMSLVVIPKFNFEQMLKSITRHCISHLLLVPPHVVLLCKHPVVKKYDLRKHVKLIMCGAAPLSFELNQKLFEMFPDAHIGQAYGMTETCTATTMWPINQKRGKSGSGGQLMPGTIARVVKLDGTLAAYDEVGELVIKTPSVALGYSNNKEATKETFIDGWIKTGDEAKIDRNGEVWILDRLKALAPAELEGCLLDHPAVSNACVVGIPDDYSGEIPVAFVVLTATAAEEVTSDPQASEAIKDSIVKKHVADHKVHYKHLAGGVEFVTAIPTSPSGKLLRRILREQAKQLKRTVVRTKL
ncbi:phenylacetyl-CoA ligase [Crucibulum laeve]|uniref:Phenylacetyl-CoA ligase n=1 Tax=Crucibulum laeve TaxID=68775 RepID=A0A5C3M0W0_9AGAR|nr:phenylacetyl-CoA ligase [Crucibulum laeve]